MQENELNELTEHLKKLGRNKKNLETSHWTTLENILKDALNDKTHLYEFNNVEDLLDQLIICLENKKKKLQPTRTISPQQLLEAKNRRKIHRLGKLLKPAERQITFSVRGINFLPENQLLPLDHHWQPTSHNPLGDQQQRWQRINTSSGKHYYVHLIPKTENNETKVSAFGNPDNPSMVYWRTELPRVAGREQGRQLGHRYQAIDNNHRKNTNSKNVFTKTQDGWRLVNPSLQSTYSYNDTENRTYGGKIQQGTGEYKIKGFVDGHAIQAKDNQLTLDPQEAKAFPTADTHPHLMYWEHEPYGRLVREKIFEQHAFRQTSSFLQVHQFNNYLNPRLLDTHGNESPRRPRKAIVPDTIYLRMNRVKGKTKTEQLSGNHTWCFPNSNAPGYAGVGDSTVKASGKTTTAAENFRDKRPNPFFPTPQVINTSAIDSINSDTNFHWRNTMTGYHSPPPTPYYLSPAISSMTLNEDEKNCHFEGEELDISDEQNPVYQHTSFIDSIQSRDTTSRSTTVNARVLTIFHPKERNKPWQSIPAKNKPNQHPHNQESKIKPGDERYYSDDMVYDLLINQFEHVQNLKIMRPLPLDQEGDTSDLIQQRLTSAFDANITLYYLPLRINGNHWIGLYIDRTPSNPLIYWINPNGGLTDSEKQNIRSLLNNTGIFNITLTDDHIKFQELALQNDGYNCGPWVVEIFKFIRREGRLPNLGEIDIHLARAQQETAYAETTDKSQSARPKTILESMSAKTVEKSTKEKHSSKTESKTTHISQSTTSFVENVRVTGGSPLHLPPKPKAAEAASKSRTLNP